MSLSESAGGRTVMIVTQLTMENMLYASVPRSKRRKAVKSKGPSGVNIGAMASVEKRVSQACRPLGKLMLSIGID